MKRKAFRTSPSIRIPRATAEKMQAAAAAAAAERDTLRLALADALKRLKEIRELSSVKTETGG